MTSKTTTKKTAHKKAAQKPVKKPEPEPVVEEEETVEDTEITEVTESEVEAVPKKKKARKQVSKETYIQDIEAIIKSLSDEITAISEGKKTTAGSRYLRGVRNRVTMLKREFPKVLKIKNPTGAKKVSGFVLPCKISPELADFLKVPHDRRLSRTEVTNAICVYIRLKPDEIRPHMLVWKHLNPEGKRNLQNPENKMAILPDEALKKLLNYDSYVKRVQKGEIKKKVKDSETGDWKEEVIEKPDLYYWAAQLLVKVHFIETIKSVKPPK